MLLGLALRNIGVHQLACASFYSGLWRLCGAPLRGDRFLDVVVSISRGCHYYQIEVCVGGLSTTINENSKEHASNDSKFRPL